MSLRLGHLGPLLCRNSTDDVSTQNLVEQARIWMTFDDKHVMPFYGIALNCGYMPALVLPFYSRGNVVNYLRRVEVDDAGKLDLVRVIFSGQVEFDLTDCFHL
jgi:hypothetical protein